MNGLYWFFASKTIFTALTQNFASLKTSFKIDKFYVHACFLSKNCPNEFSKSFFFNTNKRNWDIKTTKLHKWTIHKYLSLVSN